MGSNPTLSAFAVELFLEIPFDESPALGRNNVQLFFQAGIPDEKPLVWAARPSGLSLKGFELKADTTGKGYFMEIKVPWKNFSNFAPKSGDLVRFDIQIDDADDNIPNQDGLYRESTAIWKGTPEIWLKKSLWGAIKLTEK